MAGWAKEAPIYALVGLVQRVANTVRGSSVFSFISSSHCNWRFTSLLLTDPCALVKMAHYDIFRHHLLSKFPGYGHALWDPSPGNLYPAVEVGDVGYIR